MTPAQREMQRVEIIQSYRSAYFAANGKEIKVTDKAGWITTDTGSDERKLRLSDLEDLTAELQRRAATKAR